MIKNIYPPPYENSMYFFPSNWLGTLPPFSNLITIRYKPVYSTIFINTNNGGTILYTSAGVETKSEGRKTKTLVCRLKTSSALAVGNLSILANGYKYVVASIWRRGVRTHNQGRHTICTPVCFRIACPLVTESCSRTFNSVHCAAERSKDAFAVLYADTKKLLLSFRFRNIHPIYSKVHKMLAA